MLSALELALAGRQPGLLRDSGLDGLLRAFRTLPRGRQKDALLSPAMSLWLRAVSQGLLRTEREALRTLLAKASHAFVAPLLRAGKEAPGGFSLWADAFGDVVFPGERFKIKAGTARRDRRLSARLSEGRLELACPGWRVRVTPRDFADRGEDFLPSGIEVANNEPLLTETIDHTSTANETFSGKRLRIVARRRPGELAAAREVIDRVGRYWPQYHREILYFVRLLIPIDGRKQWGGTLKPMLGAILFSFSGDWWVDMDNLIHETAHLRLNHYLEPFVARDEGYTPAPWFGVPRRPSVLLQAGYIYLLIIQGLRRAIRSPDRFDRRPLERRISFLQAGYPRYWRIVESLPLTPLGTALVRSCRSLASEAGLQS